MSEKMFQSLSLLKIKLEIWKKEQNNPFLVMFQSHVFAIFSIKCTFWLNDFFQSFSFSVTNANIVSVVDEYLDLANYRTSEQWEIVTPVKAEAFTDAYRHGGSSRFEIDLNSNFF